MSAPTKTQLYYNGLQILSGQPTPLVGKQDAPVRYGERWATKSTITLHGQITGCGFSSLIASQNLLIQDFAKDFQTFQILESGQTIYSAPYVIVKGVNFSESNYAYTLNYDVTLDCYPQNFFSGVYGVLDPSDQWEFNETDDHLINITHTISARGFNTCSGASNAFTNAKDFVLARTGLNPNLAPYFINTASGYNPCLKSIGDRPDRFNATYSVTENYVADTYFGLDGILRYSIDFDCDQIGKSKVGVHGIIDGCGMTSDVTALRNRYSGLNIYSLASGIYSQTATGGVLNPSYISSGVTEDIYSRKLTFNVEFDNYTGLSTYLDYTVNLDSGENGITTVTFDGHIRGRGDLYTRWANVQALYSTVNPYALSVPIYNAFANGAYPLNPNPIISGVTFNSFQGIIDITESWDNKDLPPSGFRELTYTLSYTPPIEKVAATPLVNACGQPYYIADLNFANRVNFGIDGNGRLACDGTTPQQAITYLKQMANSLFGTQCPTTRAVLEANQITTGIGTVNFKFGWSAESANLVSNNYTGVQNLNL